jgi:DNA helicase-2/ATP-dependent DNA helicase PcrA
VLEDEAQDSSQIQEDVLRLLTSGHGNWVRVGDSNQAIYETFTTASPRFLRSFLAEPDVVGVKFAQSGRSQLAIIDLANHLVDWTLEHHPEPSMRVGPSSAFLGLHIVPTAKGDAQQNPPGDPSAIALVERAYSPDEELDAVARSVQRWFREQSKLPGDQRQTCAVLAPRTEHGARLADLLKKSGVPIVELLRTTASTRQTTGILVDVLSSLVDPTSGRNLAAAFRAWASAGPARTHAQGEPDGSLIEAVLQHIAGCATVEAYLWPRAGHDWLLGLLPEPSPDERVWLEGFRDIARRWHQAASLPVDQLILTLAGDLFREQADLALSHKLAVVMRGFADAHPAFRLPELVEELKSVAQNKRRFLGFAQEDTGFEPPRGVVTLTTMHKAKGLEWDRVYLTSVNNFDFPAGLAHDRYQDEKWYVRDRLSLQAEALGQLEAVKQWQSQAALPRTVGQDMPPEGQATLRARLDYVAERLRLLYVGITRARLELTITWNSGRWQGEKLQPAAALIELWNHQSRQKEPHAHV